MSNATGNWSTQQLAEFLSGIASCEKESDATQYAVERAAEALEAEICIYTRDGAVVDSIGFPPGTVTTDAVTATVDGTSDSIDVPGLGDCPVMVVPVTGKLGGHLVLARVGNNFDAAERGLVRAMARAMSLSVGVIHNLEAERERRELLTRLSRIQRSISHHAPLQDVLDAISEGASELLGEPIAALTMLDPENPDSLITRSIVGLEPEEVSRMRHKPIGVGTASQAIERDELVAIENYQAAEGTHPFFVETGVQASLGAPVREAGKVVGALVVASPKQGRLFTEAEREALTAFADHASLALTDARLTDQVDRALHDPLTGLPNRSNVSERLNERLQARSSDTALISLDLDNFRSVNDRVGHAAADGMLIELGKRISDQAGETAIVARLEGDAFALVSDSGKALALAEKLLDAVAEPIQIGGRELRVHASIGVVHSGASPAQMLRNADLAMYRAKSEGGARIVTFEPGMHTELVKRLELQDDLARALDEGEIVAHFQPKVDLRTARVIGVEALVRWDHPERGLVSPAEFLPLAEAGGHMRTLTERVIEYSTRAAGDWWHSGLGLQLSVNLAPSTFSERDWKLDAFVAQALARTGLPGKALQFEVTEDALMADSEVAAITLKNLSKLGATISIDDFGTGHSSLGRLKSLPIDELKIDRSFILDLTDDEDKTIVRSTIHLAHQMGLQVVAEGVETEEAWRQLRSMGCERAQGFLIAKPLPSREVPAWLAAWNHRARELRSTKRVQRRSKAAAKRPKAPQARAEATA
jgi:diguanylate cyclase (GGDEF)-like protein